MSFSDSSDWTKETDSFNPERDVLTQRYPEDCPSFDDDPDLEPAKKNDLSDMGGVCDTSDGQFVGWRTEEEPLSMLSSIDDLPDEEPVQQEGIHPVVNIVMDDEACDENVKLTKNTWIAIKHVLKM